MVCEYECSDKWMWRINGMIASMMYDCYLIYIWYVSLS